jgi:putative DNA primase/helicase
MDWMLELDNNPDLLPIKHGKIVDLKTGILRERTKEDKFSMESPVSLLNDEEAQLEMIESFMSELFNGNEQMVKYMQRLLGYCLTGHTSERSLFVWWGEGANGKGTLSNILKKILGKFYVTTSKDVFIKSDRGSYSGSTNSQLVVLMNARVEMFSESEKEELLNEGMIKSLTGDDPISCRPLYGKQMEFQPVCKLIIQTNHKSSIDIDSQAMLDRLKLIPFLCRFVDNPLENNEKKRNKSFVDGLLNENLDSFFTWIVKGSVQWYSSGLGTSPSVMLIETQKYVKELDIVAEFLEQICIESEDASILSRDLFAAFPTWCKQTNEKSLSHKAFAQRMKKTKFQSNRTRKGTQYSRLQIINFSTNTV